MTFGWMSLHAHTSLVDRILIEVVGPFFESAAEGLDHGFWERHYAGGPHVRIRLRGSPPQLEEVGTTLRRELELWLAANRTPVLAGYSPEHAARLLRDEGIDPATEDLEYRNGIVVRGAYPEPGKVFASPGARQLAEDFRRARGPLAIDVLRDGRPLRENLLRMFLSLSLIVGEGNYARGSVGYKSHWEGFFATCPSEPVLERIRATYDGQRERLFVIAEETRTQWQARGMIDDAVLRQWRNVLDTVSRKAASMLKTGQPLLNRLPDTDEVVTLRESVHGRTKRQSAFVNALLANERFLYLGQYDFPFQLSRALLNLLYEFVASVGLNAIEKMAICHHAWRVVEETEGCDLDELLQDNIAKVLARQEHRLGRDRDLSPDSLPRRR